MKAHAKEVAGSALHEISNTAHGLIDEAASAASPSVKWVDDRLDRVEESRKKLVEDSSTYISKNPLSAVAIAVFAGYLISRITR